MATDDGTLAAALDEQETRASAFLYDPRKGEEWANLEQLSYRG